MTNFIEVTLTDSTKVLVNVNNIVAVQKIRSTEQGVINALQDVTGIYTELGLDKLLETAIDSVNNGNTIISTVATTPNGLQNVFVSEEYNEVKKLIKEALAK